MPTLDGLAPRIWKLRRTPLASCGVSGYRLSDQDLQRAGRGAGAHPCEQREHRASGPAGRLALSSRRLGERQRAWQVPGLQPDRVSQRARLPPHPRPSSVESKCQGAGGAFGDVAENAGTPSLAA